jgi:hypothetical protein
MDDDFFTTSQERVKSDIPRIDAKARKEQRIKIVSALAESRAHKERLWNPLAKQRQDDIINFWEAQLLAFDKQHSGDWINE